MKKFITHLGDILVTIAVLVVVMLLFMRFCAPTPTELRTNGAASSLITPQ